MTGRGAPPGGVDIDVLGTRFRVGATSAETRRALADLLSPFTTAAAPGAPPTELVVVDACTAHDAGVCVHRNGAVAHCAGRPGDALAFVLAEVNAAALEGYGGFAIHAGVVARAGRAIAFPAESGSGKSTLTAALVAAGFEYVSDEALCVRFGSREVEPHPRPLTLSAWSRAATGLGRARAYSLGDGEVAVTPAAAGARAPGPGVRLAHVVAMVRADGPPGLVELPAADAMALLIRHSFNHYKRPRETFDLCATLAREARAWRLEFGDPAAAAALLLDRLGSP